MDVLIAEDDDYSRDLLQASLQRWGYRVIAAPDGNAAWELLQKPGAPRLVVLDWMMPGMDGIELCRRIREAPGGPCTYVILLTARSTKREMVQGLTDGADDYVVKPFDREELRARVQVGARVASLQAALSNRVEQLQGMLPICAYCKRVRDDDNYWHQVEVYLARHTDAQFSHGICPECFNDVMPSADHRPCA